MPKIKKENQIKDKKSFFVLKEIDKTYWNIWTIKRLNTISKKEKFKDTKGIYSLWLYNNTPNKNFYKLWYGLKTQNDTFISVVLSYPLTQKWTLKYNKSLFETLNKLDNNTLNKIIELIQLFESPNLWKVGPFIIKLLKKQFVFLDIDKIIWILKPIFFKTEKGTLSFYDKLQKDKKEFLASYWILKNNVYLFNVFFYDFFKLLNIFHVKDENKIRAIFISLLNINILFLEKVEFPITDKSTFYTKSLDLCYFQV